MSKASSYAPNLDCMKGNGYLCCSTFLPRRYNHAEAGGLATAEKYDDTGG